MKLQAMLTQVQPFALGAVFLLLFIAEHIYPQRRELLDHKHDLINMGIGVFNGVIVLAAGYGLQQWLNVLQAHSFGIFYWLGIAGILRYALEFLLQDILMYWWHRLNHRSAFLWQFHKFHHTDKKMNSTTAVRFHVIELLLSYLVRLPLFSLFGMSVEGMLLYGIFFTAVVIFHHSSIRLPLAVDFFIRRLIVTPHMHRIHHSVVREETDSNFASVFSFWDRLFGSYHKLPAGPIEFGIGHETQNASPTVK